MASRDPKDFLSDEEAERRADVAKQNMKDLDHRKRYEVKFKGQGVTAELIEAKEPNPDDEIMIGDEWFVIEKVLSINGEPTGQ